MNLSDLLELLSAYVPMPIAQSIYNNPRHLTEPSSRRFQAVVLFSDISGFTHLSEILSQAGPTGAEELTHLINQYFTSMIEIIQSYHGQVVKFSGDALTVLFPAEEISMQLAAHRAGECALSMQADMYQFADMETSGGIASLSMTVGIGAGEIVECNIGGVFGRWEYMVGGTPLEQVAMAERQAEPGQIILSPQAWDEAKSFFIADEKTGEHGFIKLHKAINPLPKLEQRSLDWSRLTEPEQKLAEKALQCYIPGAIKARLNEQSNWLAELRRMTILFVGIGGFDYSAADVGDRLQNFLQSTQELIYRFEGSLGKVAVDDKGTVLLILFGAPPLFHEDDATRGVTYALGLQTIAKSQNLRVSIGITEGAIFAGPVGGPNRREYTVIGDQVNLAARLMQYGKAGTTIISERVKEKTGSQFITESLGNLLLKGKTEPLAAYLVKGEQDSQDEFVTRYLLHEDPLIGRKSELEQIQHMAERARNGQLQLLFIEGEHGLGKSRLAAEMAREWVMAGVVGYGSKCISYGQQTPYQGWREILSAIFGLTSALSPQRQLARLAAGVAELEEPPGQSGYWADRLPLLADVLGMEVMENDFTRHISGELRRDNSFEFIEAILRSQAQKRALLILIDNLHWADELSLSLVAHLAQNLVSSPLFLVLIHRPIPEVELHALDGIKNLPYTHTINLEPFTDSESMELIKIMLGDKIVPAEAEEILLKRGQGNPFFLQEIIGAILNVAENKNQQSVELMTTFDLPDTVQDVILSRVDKLSESEKVTLKIASVIGPHFQRSLLSKVHTANKHQLKLSAQLDMLEEAKLIQLEAPAPKWEYIFYNIITQEVVYEGLLLAQRRQLHASVGAALEVLVPDEVEQLAFHYGRSNNWEKALHYLRIAGKKARREYANQAAISYHSDILNCLLNKPTADKQKNRISTEYWDALIRRAKLYNLTGQREKEKDDLDTLSMIAEMLNDDYRLALVTKQWSSWYETGGDYDSGLELIERSINLAKKAKNEKLAGEGYNQRGLLLHRLGNYEIAEKNLQQALLIAQKCRDKSTQANSLSSLGLVAHYQADYEVALYFLMEAIELWKEIGNQAGLGNSLNRIGRVYYDMGQYTVAIKHYERALALYQTIGDKVGKALAQQYLGQLQRTLGNYETSRSLLEQALVAYQSMDNNQNEARTLSQLGFLYTSLEEYDKAITFLEESLELFRDIDDPRGLGIALIYYGWSLLEMERSDLAKEYIVEAMNIGRKTKQNAIEIEAIAYLGHASLMDKNLHTANTHIKQVLDFIENQGVQGIEHPVRLYLICYNILQANKNYEKSRDILSQGQQYITSQLSQIEDETLHHLYLNIPENRAMQKLVTTTA